MSLKIVKDSQNVTVIDSGYHLYIDTDMEINSRTYGTYQETYIIEEDGDLLLKKIPEIKKLDTNLKRDISDESCKRYLHIVGKDKKDTIDGLRKLLLFKYEHPTEEDTRLYLVDLPKLKIIDYSEKSVAIFCDSEEGIKVVREYEQKCLKYNKNLTGINKKKMPGYVLSKGSKYYKEIFDKLVPSEKPKEEDFIGNGKRSCEESGDIIYIKLWGTKDYIKKEILEIEDSGFVAKVKDKKTLDEDRELFFVEICDE